MQHFTETWQNFIAQLFSNFFSYKTFFDELYTTNNYEFGVDEFYLCKTSKKRENWLFIM